MITANADKTQPFSQWEEVDVVFPPTANADIAIPHNLAPPSAEHVNYIVLRQGVPAGGLRPGTVYHDTTGARLPWQPTYIILRNTVANAKVTLLLTVSRGRRTLPF